MVVALIDGVVKLVPVPKTLPPEGDPYQLSVPSLAVAPKVTVPVPHRLAGVVFTIVGVVFTVATTSTLLEVQPALELCT